MRAKKSIHYTLLLIITATLMSISASSYGDELSSVSSDKPSEAAEQKINEVNLISPIKYIPKNFHTVDSKLGIYRSGQPNAREFAALGQAGFKSVLNLRETHRDQRKIKNTGLIEYHLPIATGDFSANQLEQALLLVSAAPKPLLIHCWHGSDRTGTVVAAVRIVFCNWNVEDAIKEMEQDEFGFHSKIYTNLPSLLRSLDWDKLRADFKNKMVLPKPILDAASVTPSSPAAK